MSDVKISVVIPLFNKESSIAKTILSVLEQSVLPFEVVVVDDGSTDNSAFEVASLSSPLVRLVRKTNGGVSSARNAGIRESRGDFVAFLDGDDLWDKGFVKEIYSLIESFEGASVYVTAWGAKSGERVFKNKIKHAPVFGLIDSYFKCCAFGETPIHSSSVVVRKSCFESVGGFNEGFSMGEDLDMWCRLAAKYKIAFSSKTLSFYRQDTENRISVGKVILRGLPFWPLLKSLDGEGVSYSGLFLTRSMQDVFAYNVKNGGFLKSLYILKSPYFYRPTFMMLRVLKSFFVCLAMKLGLVYVR